MSLFLWAVILGLVLHQTASLIQPHVTTSTKGRRQRVHKLKFGQRVIVWLPVRTYLNVKIAFFTFAAVVLILGALLIVSQKIHPTSGYAYGITDALTSPRIAAGIFGLFVGILIGNLINRITHARGARSLSAVDWVQLILIFLLLILGIGGDQLLRSYGGQISKISFGATNEIAFSDAPPNSRSAPVEQPGTAFKSAGPSSEESDFLRGGGSAGLLKDAKLADTIAKDRLYLQLFEQFENLPKLDLQPLDKMEAFARTTISPFASCLAAIYARTANAAFVTTELAGIIDQFPKLNAESALDDKPELAFTTALDHTATKAYNVGLRALLKQTKHYSIAEREFIQACTAAISLRCVIPKNYLLPTETPWLDPQQSRTWLVDARKEQTDQSIRKQDIQPNGLKGENAKTVENCLALPSVIQKERDENIISQQGHFDEFRFKPSENEAPANIMRKSVLGETIKNAFGNQFLAPNVRELPYLTMAYAGFLAQLGYYSAATLALNNWINRAEKLKNSEFPLKWYLLRARFFMAGYLEEWIRAQGNNVPLSLRQYHIDNFSAIIAGLKDRKCDLMDRSTKRQNKS